MENQVDVIVVGAAQAGLATAYYLKQRGLNFVILDGSDAVGASWRDRWDTLRLFTPAKYSSLPGYPFPADPYALPHKDEVAAYLAAYARHFDFPIQLNTWVSAMHRDGERYILETSSGVYSAPHVVIATGTFQKPNIPTFASALSPDIQQMHSTQYRNPAQINGDTVLVVGAGSSGAQIAIDLAETHNVVLSGRDPGNTPRRFLGRDIYWWFYTLGLVCITKGSLLDRLLNDQHGGDSRVGVPAKMVLDAGVRWVSRVGGVADGRIQLDDGEVLEVDAVIWSTGFKPDYAWIPHLSLASDDFPHHRRGIVEGEPGLYLMGLQSQYYVNSHLLGGVGANAAYTVDVIARRLQPSLAPQVDDHFCFRSAVLGKT